MDGVEPHKQVIHTIRQESEETPDPRSTPGLALYIGSLVSHFIVREFVCTLTKGESEISPTPKIPPVQKRSVTTSSTITDLLPNSHHCYVILEFLHLIAIHFHFFHFGCDENQLVLGVCAADNNNNDHVWSVNNAFTTRPCTLFHRGRVRACVYAAFFLLAFPTTVHGIRYNTTPHDFDRSGTISSPTANNVATITDSYACSGGTGTQSLN
jgi:hypothetical protein